MGMNGRFNGKFNGTLMGFNGSSFVLVNSVHDTWKGTSWDSGWMEVSMDVNGMLMGYYPLVICYIATENGDL